MTRSRSHSVCSAFVAQRYIKNLWTIIIYHPYWSRGVCSLKSVDRRGQLLRCITFSYTFVTFQNHPLLEKIYTCSAEIHLCINIIFMHFCRDLTLFCSGLLYDIRSFSPFTTMFWWWLSWWTGDLASSHLNEVGLNSYLTLGYLSHPY